MVIGHFRFSQIVRRGEPYTNLRTNHHENVAEEELRGGYEQLDLFTNYAAERTQREEEQAALAKERKRQETVIAIQKKYGKNSMLKGMNFEDGATTKERNHQIGGHKA